MPMANFSTVGKIAAHSTLIEQVPLNIVRDVKDFLQHPPAVLPRFSSLSLSRAGTVEGTPISVIAQIRATAAPIETWRPPLLVSQ